MEKKKKNYSILSNERTFRYQYIKTNAPMFAAIYRIQQQKHNKCCFYLLNGRDIIELEVLLNGKCGIPSDSCRLLVFSFYKNSKCKIG